MATDGAPAPIRSTIPARLDRLPWSKFHTRMVIGLGSAWILDGLQITIASSVTGVLTKPDTLDMSSTEVGLIASIYLVGRADEVQQERCVQQALAAELVGEPPEDERADHLLTGTADEPAPALATADPAV